MNRAPHTQAGGTRRWQHADRTVFACHWYRAATCCAAPPRRPQPQAHAAAERRLTKRERGHVEVGDVEHHEGPGGAGDVGDGGVHSVPLGAVPKIAAPGGGGVGWGERWVGWGERWRQMVWVCEACRFCNGTGQQQEGWRAQRLHRQGTAGGTRGANRTRPAPHERGSNSQGVEHPPHTGGVGGDVVSVHPRVGRVGKASGLRGHDKLVGVAHPRKAGAASGGDGGCVRGRFAVEASSCRQPKAVCSAGCSARGEAGSRREGVSRQRRPWLLATTTA